MFALLVSFWKAGMRGSDRRLSSRLLSRERYLCWQTLKAFHSWRCEISTISQLRMRRGQLHKKYPPSRQRPFFFTKIKRPSTLDEEGNEYLHSFNEFLDCGIRQLAAPYLKISIATGIALDEISRWLEVFAGGFLKMRVKVCSAAKGGCELIRLVSW